MTSFFHTFQKFIQAIPYKKHVLLGLVMFCGCAFAQDASKDSDVVSSIVQIFNVVFLLITFLMTPAIILAGWLLSPDWTMGDFFGLRPYFIEIWILVSNLVYIAFALLLLGMAVIQIFGSNSNYAFKKKLPRFLVGILIVPFTWLIVSWTLSFANQAVAAVLSIPLGAIEAAQDKEGKKSLFQLQTIPTEIILDFTKNAPGSIKCNDNGRAADENGKVLTGLGKNEIKCISPREFITGNDAGPFFIIMIYAYDIFKIQETNIAEFRNVCDAGNSKDCIYDLGQMLQKFGLGLITTVFFAIILIALCWVLLARAFKLWLYIMFSPLFGLAYAVGDEGLGKVHESSGGGGGEGVSLGKMGLMPFFSLAMVPVLVSAVLSFGILFIGVINTTFTEDNLQPSGNVGEFCTDGEYLVKYCITQTGQDKYMSNVTIGNNKDAQIVFQFGEMMSGLASNSTTQGVMGAAQGAGDASRDIFAHVILTLISLGILWMGIKSAVSSDEVTKMAFEPFKKFGDTVGNFVQQAPSFIPTPHPSFAAFDPATWSSAAKMGNQMIQQKETDKQNALTDILEGNASRFEEAIDGLKTGTTDFSEAVQLWRDTHERDPEDAKKLILTGIDKALSNEKLQSPDDQAQLTALRTAVEGAQGKKDLARVLESPKHETIISRAETTGGLKGLSSLASDIGATSVGSNSGTTSATAFAEHKIIYDPKTKKATGEIKTNRGEIVSEKTLSEIQKKAIKGAFPSQREINGLDPKQIKLKLRSIGFLETELDEIGNSEEDARKVAIALAKAAKVDES